MNKFLRKIKSVERRLKLKNKTYPQDYEKSVQEFIERTRPKPNMDSLSRIVLECLHITLIGALIMIIGLFIAVVFLLSFSAEMIIIALKYYQASPLGFLAGGVLFLLGLFLFKLGEAGYGLR